MPGDRVVCIDDKWEGKGAGGPDPKNGEVLMVAEIYKEWLLFSQYKSAYEYAAFAPVQDATEMESEETEFAHYEEMTA